MSIGYGFAVISGFSRMVSIVPQMLVLFTVGDLLCEALSLLTGVALRVYLVM